MRSAFTAALAALFAVLPALSGAARAAEQDVIVYSQSANAGSPDPHSYASNQLFALEMIYEPLVRVDETGAVRPCLAESWTVDDAGTAYTFTLREGVVFSDGEPFTAAAAATNFNRILADRPAHSWLELANRIASCEALDGRTLRLTLSEPYAPALRDLALPRPFRFVSPKSSAGTGPWKFAESAPGEHDRFERNETHWRGPPRAAAVLVKIIPDPVTRALALRAGEIDLVLGPGQIDYDAFAALRADPAFSTAASAPMGTVAAALNTARGPTRDRAVRRALQHAADKDALLRGIFRGAQPRADFLFAPAVPHCDIGLLPYEHAPEKARALLDEAGWTLPPGESVRMKDGSPLVIDFCYTANDAAQKAVAEVLQAQAAAAGILLNLIGEEEDSFYRRQRDGDFGMILTATWGPPFEPHAVLSSMREPGHADYRAQIGLPQKAELDAAITAVLRTNDPAEETRLYRGILTTLHDEAVYLPLHHEALPAAYRAGTLEGVRFGAGKYSIPFAEFTKTNREQ